MYPHEIEGMAVAIAKSLKIISKDGITKSPEAAEDIGLIQKALKEYWQDKIAVVWTVEDIEEIAIDDGLKISQKQAVEVLEQILDKHDATVGINWDTIRYALDKYLRSK